MSLSEYLTSESTTVEFKEELNFSKAKQWMKTISAFANTKGGVIIVGVTDEKNLVGVPDIKTLTSKVAAIIKARIEPAPTYELKAIHENGLDFLIIDVYEGTLTPYYYSAEGTRTAFIRNGDESIIAPEYVLKSLLFKGRNLSFDSVPNTCKFEDVSFTFLKATFLEREGINLNLERDLLSFGLTTSDKNLTNAGALFCDQHIIYQSRLFCTSWKNLTKGSIGEDALDDAEYDGNLLQLLNDGEKFIQHNSKKPWGIYGMTRVEHPDYPYESVREALINALIHRDYLIDGSEIHIDIFPDRLEITSPGGMPDGTKIQERDLTNVPSVRRNKIISDIFGRLHLMDRRGSGFERMLKGYSDTEKIPSFNSEASHFKVIFPNINYSPEEKDSIAVKSELSERERDIIKLIRANPEITVSEINEQLGISIKQIRTSIENLKTRGLLKRIGSKKTGLWILSLNE